jgi:hypothetical protein
MAARPTSALALLALCLSLGACGTPQERCVASVTRDLRVVDGLIGEAQVNLARGYGMRESVVFVPVWDYCGPPVVVQPQGGGTPVVVPAQLCLDDRAQTVRRPVAIDLDAERRKLAQLQDQRARLARQAGPAIAQCRTLYPQ